MAFTWRRISDNSSNYSAWHFRGELLKQLIEEKYSSSIDNILSLLQSGRFRVVDDLSLSYPLNELLIIFHYHY